MSTNDRLRRPTLERAHPIRDWAGLLGQEPGAPPPVASDAPSRTTGQAERVTNAVSRSVEIGYRVIDDYLQQGRRVARRLGEGTSAPELLATEAQDLGARMARYASDFMAAWMELLELTARGGQVVPPTPSPASPPRSTAPEAATNGRRGGERVRVQVASPVPVEVDVDYRPERVTGPVLAHALRTVAPDTPLIRDVSLEAGPDGSAPRLVVSVPAGQPAGTYQGLLVDEATNRPVGNVSLTVVA